MSVLAQEAGTVRKRWTGRLPIALLYPNIYPVAVSNLGFQLIYSLLNAQDDLVCERFVYPEGHGQRLRSLESDRPLADFPLILASISFEADFPHLPAMLLAGGIEPWQRDRPQHIGPGTPLILLGGAALMVNPEPLAPFADLIVIGEAEPVLSPLLALVTESLTTARTDLLRQAAVTLPGIYAPSFYRITSSEDGAMAHHEVAAGLPERVVRVHAPFDSPAGHSRLLTPEAELSMYMAELGRGCSRGCRFCAAGYIYRPPRLWTAESVLAALADRPAGMDRVGLVGMEMAADETLDRIAGYLSAQGCALSFSSLRADRISEQVLRLLSASGLKSVAIAPDGASQRLRRVINKGLDEGQLLESGQRLVDAGIVHLKLYVMLGLPTETMDDLDELIALVRKMQQMILPIGRRRGRVTELSLSVNCFIPKPWTPFQYVGFGGAIESAGMAPMDEHAALAALKAKIGYLRKGLAGSSNLRIKTEHPERALQQAVFSRGDRRLAAALLDIGLGKRNFKQAIRAHRLSVWQYAVRPLDDQDPLVWEVIDHGLKPGYLWQEYQRALRGKTTQPCDTTRCRRCGICDAGTAN